MPEIRYRVGPKEIAQETMGARFLLSIHLHDQIDVVQKLSGGYRGERRTEVKSLSVTSCGESPPWTQKNFPSTSAAIGRAQKERRQASYTASEYLCRPGCGP